MRYEDLIVESVFTPAEIKELKKVFYESFSLTYNDKIIEDLNTCISSIFISKVTSGYNDTDVSYLSSVVYFYFI